jgi:hypothetical protein
VVVDSYSSTENAVIVQRVPGMPPGSLGRPLEGVKVLDPETLAETPDAVFDEHGRLLNAEAATGELVNTKGAGAFAGYYNDPDADAERLRGGMYWSGDLAYRDAVLAVEHCPRVVQERTHGRRAHRAPVRMSPTSRSTGRAPAQRPTWSIPASHTGGMPGPRSIRPARQESGPTCGRGAPDPLRTTGTRAPLERGAGNRRGLLPCRG